jgi:hypothetical protein
MTEEWRPVVGFEGLYAVSSLGRVRSLPRQTYCPTGPRGPRTISLKGRVLSASRDSKGYPHVGMRKDGAGVTIKIHVLVAAAFIGPRPAGHQVCHIDGVKTNNAPENLYYGTPKQNAADSDRLGTRVRGSRVAKAKLNDDAIRLIRVMAESMRQIDIAPMFGVDSSVISRIVAGKTWGHVA